MTKRIISIAVCALLVVLGCVCAFAAEEPKVTADTICYISFQTGNNEYDGMTADTPKKQLLTTEDNAAMGVLKDGGTMIAVGKLWIGGEYVMPELGSTLKITSNDGKKDYRNPIPFENPSCAMKMASGATLTLQQDTIIDDIILFQENAMNTIKVTNNSTLLIGDKIECMNNINSINPCYMAIEVEKGSTVILNGGIFENVSGEGTIINNGATIQSEAAAVTTAPAETTVTSAAEVTTAPAETTTVVVSDTTVEVTTAEPIATSGEESVATDDTVSEVVATTEEVGEATVAATTAEENVTTPAAEIGEPAIAPAPTEGGSNVGLIIGIVAAVLVVIAVVVVIVVKKKK